MSKSISHVSSSSYYFFGFLINRLFNFICMFCFLASTICLREFGFASVEAYTCMRVDLNIISFYLHQRHVKHLIFVGYIYVNTYAMPNTHCLSKLNFFLLLPVRPLISFSSFTILILTCASRIQSFAHSKLILHFVLDWRWMVPLCFVWRYAPKKNNKNKILCDAEATRCCKRARAIFMIHLN